MRASVKHRFRPVHKHVGIGECEICGHSGKDCKGVKRELRRNEEIMLAVTKAARAQTDFWNALTELESLCGHDVDGNQDLLEVLCVSDLRNPSN